MSKSPHTMVSFDGIYKSSKDGQMSFKPVHIRNNTLEIDPSKDYGHRNGKGSDIIKRLRTHPANRANSGNLFWELDDNTLDTMEFASGKLVAREPAGGITSELYDQLNELYGVTSGYDKKDHEILVEETRNLFDMFSVMGLPKPEVSYDQKRFIARLVEFFAILKERAIFEPIEGD